MLQHLVRWVVPLLDVQSAVGIARAPAPTFGV